MVRDPQELDRLAAELAALTAEERARVLAAVERRLGGPVTDEGADQDGHVNLDAEGWDELDATPKGGR